VRIGVDVGGTKIEGLALSDTGEELDRIRVPTPRGDYDATVAAIADVVHRLESSTGEQGTVGMGTPGSIDPATGVIKGSNSVALNGRPLAADVGAALGREARIANDADCLALSEAIDGAAAGEQNVFAAILGTGVGGGIVIGSRPVGGPNAIAGEWGHNPLPWPRVEESPGPYCYCGRRGCIERWLSGPALERQHAEITGELVGADEVSARIESGDPGAMAALEFFADRAARALASIINVLDPDVIVLGGGVSNIEALYTAVPALWDRYVFSDTVLTRLRQAVHGDSSGVRGAAWLWPE
jgi:fructokinase